MGAQKGAQKELKCQEERELSSLIHETADENDKGSWDPFLPPLPRAKKSRLGVEEPPFPGSKADFFFKGASLILRRCTKRH